MDPLENPDYTLIVRVQDQGGVSETALSGNTRVSIAVQQNLWISPGPITIAENLKGDYPRVIAQVRWAVHNHTPEILRNLLTTPVLPSATDRHTLGPSLSACRSSLMTQRPSTH